MDRTILAAQVLLAGYGIVGVAAAAPDRVGEHALNAGEPLLSGARGFGLVDARDPFRVVAHLLPRPLAADGPRAARGVAAPCRAPR